MKIKLSAAVIFVSLFAFGRLAPKYYLIETENKNDKSNVDVEEEHGQDYAEAEVATHILQFLHCIGMLCDESLTIVGYK